MLLRMEMRWAERRGMKVELKEASAGRGGGPQVGDLHRAPARTPTGSSRPRRASTGWCGSRRSTPPRGATRAFARRRGGAAGRGRARSRSTRRPPDRHLPRVRRRRPARQQDRLGRADHPQAVGDRRAVPERALAVVEQETAMKMLRSKLIELEEQRRREEIAREKGEAQDVGWGSQIRSYVLHPYTMVKDHRTDDEMGDAQRRARRRPRRVRARGPRQERAGTARQERRCAVSPELGATVEAFCSPGTRFSNTRSSGLVAAGGLDLESGRDRRAPVQRVLDVDALVLAVGAGDPEQDQRPAPAAGRPSARRSAERRGARPRPCSRRPRAARARSRRRETEAGRARGAWRALDRVSDIGRSPSRSLRSAACSRRSTRAT